MMRYFEGCPENTEQKILKPRLPIIWNCSYLYCLEFTYEFSFQSVNSEIKYETFLCSGVLGTEHYAHFNKVFGYYHTCLQCVFNLKTSWLSPFPSHFSCTNSLLNRFSSLISFVAYLNLFEKVAVPNEHLVPAAWEHDPLYRSKNQAFMLSFVS